MNSIWKTFWQGIKNTVKWIVIQYLVIGLAILIYEAGLYFYSLKTGDTMRHLLSMYPLGSHGLYSFDVALLLAIPFYTTLFAFWQSFFEKGKRWTYVFPWIIWMAIMFLIVAGGQEWRFKIITIDEYLLGGWLAPIYGISIQSLFFFLRKLFKNNISRTLAN